MAFDLKSQDAFEAELRMALRIVHDDDTQVRNCSTLFRKKPSRIDDCCKLWLNFFQNSPKVKGIKSEDDDKAMDKVRKHRLGLLYVFNDTIQRIRSEVPSCLESFKQAFYPRVLEACKIQSKDKNSPIIQRWERTFKVLGDRKCFSAQDIDSFIDALHGTTSDVVIDTEKEEEVVFLNYDDEVRVIDEAVHLAEDFSNIGIEDVYDEEDKTRRLRECKLRKQCLSRFLELLDNFNKHSTKQDKQRNDIIRERILQLLVRYNELQEKLFLFGTAIPPPVVTTQPSIIDSNISTDEQQNIQSGDNIDNAQDTSNCPERFPSADKLFQKNVRDYKRSPSPNNDRLSRDNPRNGRDYRDRRKEYDNGHRHYYDPKPKIHPPPPSYNNYHRRPNEKYSFGRRRDDYHSRGGYGSKDRGNYRERSPRRYNTWGKSRSPEKRRSSSRSPTRRSNFYYNKQRYD
uniref:CID domain-containing protein n=1 Tax=Strongyloides papillosus TaxID=174720 RepID=A0A0N5BTG6_STREA